MFENEILFICLIIDKKWKAVLLGVLNFCILAFFINGLKSKIMAILSERI